MELYERLINKNLLVRRINVTANKVVTESEAKKQNSFEQIDLFTNYNELEKKSAKDEVERNRQKALINIKSRYGKNPDNVNRWKNFLVTLIFTLIPFALIVKEPDLSTTILMTTLFFTSLFISGFSYKKIGIILGIFIPIVAIGGIEYDDIDAIMSAGVHGIAVSGALVKADNMVEATCAMIDKLKAISAQRLETK